MAKRKFGLVSMSRNEATEELRLAYRPFEARLFDGHLGLGELSIRDHWPAELKRRLAAAMVSSHLGIGLGYALKTYIPNDGYDPSPLRVDHKVETFIDLIDREIHDLYGFEKGESSPDAEFFGGFALMKALTTLQSAHHLAQQGYLLEVGVLVRVSLETLAWGRACLYLDDYFLDLTTTEALTRARSDLPFVGRLYGFTSKFAHWHPDFHLAFVSFRSETSVISRASAFKPVALSMVVTLYVIALRVFQDLMRRFWPNVDLSELLLVKERAAQVSKLLDPAHVTEERLRILHAEAFSILVDSLTVCFDDCH